MSLSFAPRTLTVYVMTLSLLTWTVAAPAGAATPSSRSPDPIVAAAGDIACGPGDRVTSDRCHQRETANLVMSVAPNAVLALGDLQYGGELKDNAYDQTWGQFKSITRPVFGNHDHADDYFEYFGAAAGEPGKGYYSFNLGSWHLIALNSECDAAGGCQAGSAQERWLAGDLAAHQNTCTLAYWHSPRYASGHDGDNVFMSDIWQRLYAAGADVVLSGHSHNYERFVPQDNNRNHDPKGITQFVVGTGGAFFTGLGRLSKNSVAQNNDTFGVLKLVLHPSSYDWQFIPEDNKGFTDSGSAACH